MTPPAPLEKLGWLDAVEETPLLAVSGRFLWRYLLPHHGLHFRREYAAALAPMERLKEPDARALAARGRLRRILGDASGAQRDF